MVIYNSTSNTVITVLFILTLMVLIQEKKNSVHKQAGNSVQRKSCTYTSAGEKGFFMDDSLFIVWISYSLRRKHI
jgi:hypothetical protein